MQPDLSAKRKKLSYPWRRQRKVAVISAVRELNATWECENESDIASNVCRASLWSSPTVNVDACDSPADFSLDSFGLLLERRRRVTDRHAFMQILPKKETKAAQPLVLHRVNQLVNNKPASASRKNFEAKIQP